MHRSHMHSLLYTHFPIHPYTDTPILPYAQIFSQSLESWKQKNPALPVSPQRPVGILDYLTEEEVETYHSAAHTTQALMEL